MEFQSLTTSLPNDPLAAFARLVDQHDNCFLLETLGDEEQPLSTGKSYIGVAPEHVYAADKDGFSIDGVAEAGTDPWLQLASKLQLQPQLPAGYCGGLVGYLSHEAMHYIEPSLEYGYDRQFYDFQFGDYRDGLVFDPGQAPRYFTHGPDRRELYQVDVKPNERLQITPLAVEKDEQQYHRMVEQARDDIQHGRVFQVVLADAFSYEFQGNLVALYRELRQINPSPFMFFLKFGNFVTIGASPELLMHVDSNRQLYLEALAGTIKRGQTPHADKQLAEALRSDEKERAEHSMLVDLARNDVGRVSQVGSVRIDKLMYLKRLSHVQHLCSLISGSLRPDKTAFDAVAASFPAGTLVGAPKIEAAHMIRELEGYERGPYGGTVGYFSLNGEAMHAVNIRSVQALDNQLYVHTGSGIVYDSQPDREYQEILAKKTAMDRAMAPFIKEAS